MAMDDFDKREAINQMRLALQILWNNSRELLADNPELTPEGEWLCFRKYNNELDGCVDALAETLGLE